MLKMSKTKLVIVGGTTALALAGAGTAIAYWTAGGTTTGTGALATTAALTVVGTSVTGLYPGASQPLSVTISNPNNYAIHVDSVSTAFAQALGCSAADFTITPPTGGTPTVPANGSITWAGGSLAMNETNVNQDGCKPSGTPTNTGTITYTVH